MDETTRAEVRPKVKALKFTGLPNHPNTYTWFYDAADTPVAPGYGPSTRRAYHGDVFALSRFFTDAVKSFLDRKTAVEVEVDESELTTDHTIQEILAAMPRLTV